MNPTTTTQPDNFYACLMNDDNDANNDANDTHRTHRTNLADSAHDLKPHKPPTDYALSDSGASGHFLTDSTQVINKIENKIARQVQIKAKEIEITR